MNIGNPPCSFHESWVNIMTAATAPSLLGTLVDELLVDAQDDFEQIRLLREMLSDDFNGSTVVVIDGEQVDVKSVGSAKATEIFRNRPVESVSAMDGWMGGE